MVSLRRRDRRGHSGGSDAQAIGGIRDDIGFTLGRGAGRAAAMRPLWRRVGLIAAGLFVGGASAAGVIWLADPLTSQTRAGWRSNPAMGAELANPYMQSLAANLGFMPMARSEAIYFKRERGEHDAFAQRCAYEVRVPRQAAHWWSLTIYRPLGGLPLSRRAAWSIDASAGRPGPDGVTTIRVAPTRDGAPNWIATTGAGAFSLWLRLYQPAPDAAATTALPSVRDLGCGAGS